MKVYHYTKDFHRERILNDGIINTDKIAHPSGGSFKAPFYVWLTSEEYMPNTSRPIFANQEYQPVAFYRFIFDSEDERFLPWKEVKHTLLDSRELVLLEKGAVAQGDRPNRWFVSSQPIDIGEYEPAFIHPKAPRIRISA